MVCQEGRAEWTGVDRDGKNGHWVSLVLFARLLIGNVSVYGQNIIYMGILNANLTLRLATVDALACLEPQTLVYIDIVSVGWYFV